MAKVNLVRKQARMGHRDIVKFQILTYCFMNDVKISENGLNCLTFLSVQGETDLSEFCETAADEGIFKNPQSVRNFLSEACSLNLAYKSGKNKKVIGLSDQLQVQTEGSIVLDYKMAYVTEAQ